MQIRAATINGKGGDFKKETIGLDEAQGNEVLLRIAASCVKRQPPEDPGLES